MHTFIFLLKLVVQLHTLLPAAGGSRLYCAACRTMHSENGWQQEHSVAPITVGDLQCSANIVLLVLSRCLDRTLTDIFSSIPASSSCGALWFDTQSSVSFLMWNEFVWARQTCVTDAQGLHAVQALHAEYVLFCGGCQQDFSMAADSRHCGVWLAAIH